MNRPGGMPPSLRGIQTSFQPQPQPQQSNRPAASNRLPNGKMGSNGSGWAFGAAGLPLGGSGLPSTARQMGTNMSFAQSLSGSQPATPLDMSEFPTLSTNSQLSNAATASMWAAGTRPLGGPGQRSQANPLSAQTNQQDDIFNTSARMTSAQGTFRFGNHSSARQSTQNPSSGADEFPPLSRAANGEMGQERTASLMNSLGFGSQLAASASGVQSSRTGNGLLNALNANARAIELRSPMSGLGPQDTQSLIDDELRGKMTNFRETGLGQSTVAEGAQLEGRNPLGAIGNDLPPGKGKENGKGDVNEVQDPLEGMAPVDKYGLKGLCTLMNNFHDFNAVTVGIDPNNIGLDLTSSEPIATQIYSLFDDVPPRPAIPKHRLPECYQVKNVQPIETKIQSFNEETLMWIFYSSPGDIKQHLAASELTNRNWRWHRKLQLWLTKDDIMVPQQLSNLHERGFYIVWDTQNWRKERRELTLHYSDLDNPLSQTGLVS